MRPSALVLLSCLFSVGCAAGDDAGNASFAVRDSAGIEIVENGRTGVWGDPPATAQEVVRIGVAEGPDHLQFFRILSLDVAADGTIYVGNDQTGTVRAFTPDGTFLHEFGGKGRGPGEYIMVNRVWTAGDSVVITDWQSGGRNGVYDRNGQLAAFWSSAQIGGGRLFPTALTPLGWVASYSPPYRPPAVAPGEKWEVRGALVRFDPVSATMGDTLFLGPPYTLYGSPATEGLDWSLFDASTQMDFDAAGTMYLSHGEPYRIDMYQPIHDAAARTEAGSAFRLARIITREIDPVPITESDIEQLKARLAERYDTMTSRPAEYRNASRDRIIRRIENQRSFNPRPYLPPLRNLLVSPDGSFWIERADIASPADLEYESLYGSLGRGGPRATRWDLYDTEGRFLTQVDLPPRFTPHAARGLEVTGVLKDELDIEYVVTYRISPALAVSVDTDSNAVTPFVARLRRPPSSPAVRRPPFVARRSSPAVRRPPFVARLRRPPFVARRSSPAVRRPPSSPAVRRPSFVARRSSPVVRRPPFVVRRLSSAVCRPPSAFLRIPPFQRQPRGAT